MTSFYGMGLSNNRLLPRSGSNYNIGALMVATPGHIKDEAVRLNVDVETMDSELGAERKTWPPNDANPTGTLSAQQAVMDQWYDRIWTPFMREWDQWFGDHGRTWGFRLSYENFWGSAWDKVQEYRRRLIDMRRSAEAVGYRFSSPAPAPPKASSQLLLRSRNNYNIGALVATPGHIKDEAVRLNVDVETMDSELGAERKTWPPNDANPTGKLSAQQAVMDQWYDRIWTPFMREWDQWFGDHGRTWGFRLWYENFWGSSWDKVQEYRRRLIDMRRSAEAVGYRFSSPAPAPPKESGSGFGDLWSLVKTLVYVGIFAIGGFLLLRMFEVWGRR